MNVIVYFEELPTPEEWTQLGKMLLQGYKSGIDQPPSMNWELRDDDE